MLSKAHIHMSKQLKKIANSFKIILLTEVKEGNKKYDFYFPSSPPIVIEVDGNNHNQTKADGFFFKTSEALSRYKQNDEERNFYHRLGKIILFRFTDKDFPNVSELLEIFGAEVIEILKNGEDKRNAYYKAIEYNKEQDRRRKEKAKEYREQLKEKHSYRN